jgi:hypothetical protein
MCDKWQKNNFVVKIMYDLTMVSNLKAAAYLNLRF